MSFFFKSQTSMPKRCMPRRIRVELDGKRIRKLQKRVGKRQRRLQLLKKFQPGHVYSFAPMQRLDQLDEDLLLWTNEIDKELNHGC